MSKIDTALKSETDASQLSKSGEGVQESQPPETAPPGKSARRQCLELLLLAMMPAALSLYLFLSHPFKETLVSRSIELSKYSSSQRLNFLTAAKSLDGTIIKPHRVFSFNGRVGPRQNERGFVSAPSYLNGQKQTTTGGGICLVSSTLYQLALLSGLDIVERTPHTETVRSVAPGLDATVWYGRTDLKFRNPYDAPVAIYCHQDGDRLTFSLKSDTITKLMLASHQPSLRRCEIASDSQNLLVEVFLKDGRGEHLVSRNRYHRAQ